jgi:Fe-S-cluster-containing dehydrogenase component
MVLVDGDKCSGCRLCIGACPTGAMSFNEFSRTAGKCDFCRERVASGIEPSCVQHCIGGALRYMDPDDLQEVIRGKHTASFGRITYTSSKWKLSVLAGRQGGDRSRRDRSGRRGGYPLRKSTDQSIFFSERKGR